MKFIWEEDDIKAGLRYTRDGIEEVWMIAYHTFGDTGADRCFTSVSLSDGMIMSPASRPEMATSLTSGRYKPLDFKDLKKA